MSFLRELKNTWLTAWNTKSVNVEKVTIDYDKEEVFDISMPRHHNFFANGVLAHNCHRLDWKNLETFRRGIQEDEKPTSYTKILLHFLKRNPKLQIIGGSGSPWRNNEWMKGPFWKSCIDRKDTMDLVREGFLVPARWGATDAGYDYSSMDYQVDEFFDTEVDLDEAQRLALEQPTITEDICREVVKLSEKRNAVLIFCSGQDHLKETKAALLLAGTPEEQIGIITESTGYQARKKILDDAKKGECKYVLNVAVLTTGVNVPLWDCLVFMRPVGSVVLFTQSVGRVLRKHDDAVKELGYPDKKDALILDYAGVFERLGHLAEELSDEEATFEEKKKKQQEKECANCEKKMSYHAAICPHCAHDHGEPKICKGAGRIKGCGKKSKSTARRCERCHTPLKDVNENLSNKHYQKREFDEVSSMGFSEPSAA